MIVYINFTIFLLTTILLFSNVKTNDDGILKTSAIEDIVKKVGNITLSSLINAEPEAKSTIIENIKHKLMKSAFSYGEDRQKYVKYIMEGINQMSSIKAKTDGAENNPDLRRKTNAGDTNNQTDVLYEERKAKEQAIKNIAAKIEILAKRYFKNAKTPEDKESIMENIKKKIMDSAYRKHMKIHTKHDEIKSYSNLIAKGIELMMERNKENGSRRMDDKSLDDNINTEGDTNTPTTEPISTISVINNEVIFDKLECGTVIENTCSSAKSLIKFTCRLDKKKLPLEKLCDGVSDCLDQSDEQDCAIQAINKIQSAGRIISNVELSLSHKCFTADVTEPFLSKQNQVLLGVLNAQLKFIQKYTDTSPSSPNLDTNDVDKNTLKKTTNEVALVVSSLGRALDASLCARRFGAADIDELSRKSMDNSGDEPSDDINTERTWSPKSCGCSGPLCTNSTCSDLCNRICRQKHSLDRWTCHAVDNGPSVSLDVICDGKLDCYDESDEHGCTPGLSNTKFEAIKSYEDILKQIATKARTKEHNWILKELLALHDSIKLLQKLSTKRNVENMNVKIVREQCFLAIHGIYDKALNNADISQINNIYSFLISMNEKLVGAMKRSGTGNEKILSSTDGQCFCTGSKCGIPKCSQTCIKVCAVEPTLTKYACDNSKSNATLVPIEAVCNGKPNCPNGKDEDGCMKDICRAYHLRVLRHNIQDVGFKQKGTTLGESLKSWKTKVTSALIIAEKNDRPTPNVLKDIISTILHDLTMSYATIEEFRRSSTRSEYALKEYARISQLVVETLKSCDH